MSRALAVVLIVTNLITGYELYRCHKRYEAAVSDKTTNHERDRYGAACVDWLNDKTKEREVTLALGRSWKKHGQMVFEVMPASEKDWETARKKMSDTELPAILCTYDRQSGMMVAVVGDERDSWMFY